MIAERAGIGTDEAFNRLRQHARSNNLRLADVAADVTNGTLAVNAFGGARALRSLHTEPQSGVIGALLGKRSVRPLAHSVYFYPTI